MLLVYALSGLFLGSLIQGAEVYLEADGSTEPYELINSVLGGTAHEDPDCSHPAFGPHITDVFDNTLNRWVFVFHIHVTPDDDRCTNFDRQRNEIKTYGPSPDYLKGFEDEVISHSWNFRLDAGFQPSTSFTHIHQLKLGDGPNADAPLITLTPRGRSSGDAMTVLHIDDAGVTTTVVEVSITAFLGTWVHVYERVRYSGGTAGTFYIRATRESDGSQLFSYTDNNLDMWRAGSTFCRPKWGIYRSLNNPDDLRDEMVRFDRFCFAKGSDNCEE